MGNNGVYVWKVEVYGHENDTYISYGLIPRLSRIFTSKVSAMDYAFKMQQKTDGRYEYYKTKIVKWFGN